MRLHPKRRDVYMLGHHLALKNEKKRKKGIKEKILSFPLQHKTWPLSSIIVTKPESHRSGLCNRKQNLL